MRRARPDSVGKSGGSVPSSKLQVHGATLQHETCQQASPQKRFHSPALHCVASVAVIAGRASAAISATSPRGAVFQEGKDRCERTARMRCELNSSCVGCRNVSGRRVWFVWISRSFAYSDRYKFWILQYRDRTLSNSAGFSCWSRENSCHALALPAPRRRAVRWGTKKIGDRAERTKSC